MTDAKYFLSDIYMTEDPMRLKFIDLETGDFTYKFLTDFVEDKTFLNLVSKKDNYQVGVLMAMSLAKEQK